MIKDSTTMPPPRLPPQTWARAKRETRSRSRKEDQTNMAGSGSCPPQSYGSGGIRCQRLLGGEDCLRLLNARDQRIDVALVVVDVERSAGGRRHLEPSHERLRAVMAGTHANADLIENGGNVVR